MALEDLTGNNAFLDALVRTNPTADDDRSEGDNHIRGVKNVLLNSFPQVAGIVDAPHGDLSACKGATSAFQPQIDALDGRVTQNEQDIDDLQIGGGGLPPVKGILWTDQTQITVAWSNSPIYQLVNGSAFTIPASWGVGTIKVDVSINMLLSSMLSGGSGQQHILNSDLAIFVNNSVIAQFASVLGSEGWSSQNSRTQIQNLVNVSVLIAATGGQTIDVRARQGFGQEVGGSLKINNLGVQSYMSIMRSDFQS